MQIILQGLYENTQFIAYAPHLAVLTRNHFHLFKLLPLILKETGMSSQNMPLWHNSAQLHPTLCGPTDCSPPVSSVHRNSPDKNSGAGCHFLFQGSFQPRGWTCVSCVSCIVRWILYHWAIWETVDITELKAIKQKMQEKFCLPSPLFCLEAGYTFFSGGRFLSAQQCTREPAKKSYSIRSLHIFTSLQFAVLGSLKLFSFVLSFLYKCIVVCWKCYIKWKSLNRVQLFATPWTIQSMEFSRPEYWSG